MFKQIPLLTMLGLLIIINTGCSNGSTDSGPPGNDDQIFVQVDDGSNALVSAAPSGGYTGTSWVDYDADGDIDLFLGNSKLFRNEGNGSFADVSTSIGQDIALAAGNGNTWGDYDNDGDLDVFISGQQSKLYRNDGSGNFTEVTTGDIGEATENRGWSSSWADYDNDGNLDLFITHPAGFVPPNNSPTSNHLFRNAGPPNYELVRVTSEPQTSGLDAYTVGSWSDYDSDGDMDLFIGSGPANGSFDEDNLFQNSLIETGSASFSRITASPIATTELDGQLWNWIDYDNDGDLDAYVTNWAGQSGGLANNLFRNEGNGSFTDVQGQPLVTNQSISLSSVWGDYDNDGDLDVFVANDNSRPDKLYINEGGGTFSEGELPNNLNTHRGATAGDYDNDGDLDLFVTGPNNVVLLRNESDNENNWLSISLEGTTSNRTAIGAKIITTATIGGEQVTQLRELSSQNTFNGHNSYRIHFGLGDATEVERIEIQWPGGAAESITQAVSANQFIKITEGSGIQ